MITISSINQFSPPVSLSGEPSVFIQIAAKTPTERAYKHTDTGRVMGSRCADLNFFNTAVSPASFFTFMPTDSCQSEAN